LSITIRDIAKKLSLSVGTVSRALDGYPDISQETRQRVIVAAQEMGYVPNQAARQLRRKKADAIGYLLPPEQPRFTDPFLSEFIAGLGDEAASHQFDLIVSTTPPGLEAEQHLYQHWVSSNKIDGIVLNRIHLQDKRVRYLAEKGFPFSGLEYSMDGIDYPRIEVDGQAGLIGLVEHITRQGFKRIAYVGGPSTLKIQVDRLQGYQTGLIKAGLTLNERLVLEGDLTSTGGYQSARRLLSIPDPPDAIVCINDETAFGVLHAAYEAGRIVGKDLAVAGFDGLQDAKYTQPPLTTLDQPIYDIARQLVKMLLAQITGQPLPEHKVMIQPALLIRESTCAAKS
jgi:LacI family transcriptional regulator